MSRADKTLTQIIYEVRMDDDNSQIEELKVTTLCAQKTIGKKTDRRLAFKGAHIAAIATYRFSNRNEVQKFKVPRQAARLLK